MAQLTDLQMRVTTHEATITSLKQEVERLTRNNGRTMNVSAQPFMPNNGNGSGNGRMMTSIPLQGNNPPSTPRRPTNPSNNGAPKKILRPRVQTQTDNTEAASESHVTQIALNSILREGEDVMIRVGTGKDNEGRFQFTHCFANFDGTQLIVDKCELAPGLVGMKSAKPGEILYAFMSSLKENGHINAMFKIAPWKLCSVERDGETVTLDKLAKAFKGTVTTAA